MTARDKALLRFRSCPPDYRWDELVSVLKGLGFSLKKGAGSRRKFVSKDGKRRLYFHQPHPDPCVRQYQIEDAIEQLEQWGGYI